MSILKQSAAIRRWTRRAAECMRNIGCGCEVVLLEPLLLEPVSKPMYGWIGTGCDLFGDMLRSGPPKAGRRAAASRANSAEKKTGQNQPSDTNATRRWTDSTQHALPWLRCCSTSAAAASPHPTEHIRHSTPAPTYFAPQLVLRSTVSRFQPSALTNPRSTHAAVAALAAVFPSPALALFRLSDVRCGRWLSSARAGGARPGQRDRRGARSPHQESAREGRR